MEKIKTYYLDASAIVRIFLHKESGSDTIREYYREYSNFYTSSLCVGEVLGVLKRKFSNKEITVEEYFSVSYEVLAHVRDGRIVVQEVDIRAPFVFTEVEELARKHSLDIVDALQIHTLKTGSFKFLEVDSETMLITADRLLAQAANTEGLTVWNCGEKRNATI